MLAVIAVILALFGLFGTWPILTKGIFRFFTGYSVAMQFQHELNARIGAYMSPDGWALLVFSIILIIMMFKVTTPLLLKIRRILIGIVWFFYLVELIVTLSAHLPFHSFAGLLFTFIMLSGAFGLSFTQLGSKSALVSSMQGQPTSEIMAASKTITQFINNATNSFKWKIEVQDSQARVLDRKEFSGKVILKIGRDPGWADVLIDPENKFVSRKHITFTAQENGVVVRFEDAKYAVKINGKLHKPSERMFLENQLNLDVELIAEWGPYLKISVQPAVRSILHPKSVASLSGQLVGRYKTTRMQIKLALILILVSVLGMGSLSMISTTKVEALYAAKINEIKKDHQKLKQQKIRIRKILNDRRKLSKKKEELERQLQDLEHRLRRERGRNEQLITQMDSLKTKLQRAQRVTDATYIQQIESVLQSIQDLVLGKSVFLGMLKLTHGISAGTVWIGNVSDQYYLITADHVIYPEDHENLDDSINVKDSLYLCLTYSEGRPDTSNITEDDFIVIPRSKFSRYKNIDIAVMRLDNLNDIVKLFAIPVKPAIRDSIINSGDFVSWFGFPNGQYSSGAVGICTELQDDWVICNTPIYKGASGGPLFRIGEDQDITAFAIVSAIQIGHQTSNKFSLLKEEMFR